jgi:hypothetical protein
MQCVLSIYVCPAHHCELQGPQMPTRGGFLAFFEQAGTKIIELPYHKNVSGGQLSSLHATLETLSSQVQAAVGGPRNSTGFVPVPEPAPKVVPQVRSHPSDPNRLQYLAV